MGYSKFHPACLLFPPLADDELRLLADDIKQRGLLHPIITHEGMILDGRNRLAACKIAGVEPRFEEWQETGSPIEWAISTNLHRRHLTASQKAALALEILPMLEDEAKKRQRLSAGRGKKVAKELATNNGKGKSSQFAAKLVGTNSAYIELVKSITRKAPELIELVKLGSLTVREASRLSKLDSLHRERFLVTRNQQPDEKFNRLLRSVLATQDQTTVKSPEAKSNPQIEIWCGDCVNLMKERIEDESVDVICTSPPLNRGIKYRSYVDDLDPVTYSAWMDEVFKEFVRILKPTGSLFLIMGHSPRRPLSAFNMVREIGQYLALQNQIIWVKSISIDGKSHGHFTPIPGPRFLNRNWDFIFHFSKTGNVELDRKSVGVPYVDQNNAVRSGDGDGVRCDGDVWFVPFETIHSGSDRGSHPATFPPALGERCLKLAGCTSDSLVLDPFCGVNGLIAASHLGINAIGIDIDPEYCRIASQLSDGDFY